MYANKVKKVVAVHDLSGVGRVSLTVVIPILSSMGFQVCPLPTAVLSSHTQYPEFSFLDLTDEMPKIISEWKKLEVQFDAFYTGYLGSPRQIHIVSDFIDDFRRPDGLVVVDPVLGDNGRLYANFHESMIDEMKHLITKADVVTPNLTELFYLLGIPYKEMNTDEELKSYLRRLSDCGPEVVIITSVPVRDDKHKTSVYAYNRNGNRYWKVTCPYLPAHYPGTGDTFTSVITGALLQGDSLPIALDRATQFILQGIRATFGYEYDNREGIQLEKVLHNLDMPIQICSYELILNQSHLYEKEKYSWQCFSVAACLQQWRRLLPTLLPSFLPIGRLSPCRKGCFIKRQYSVLCIWIFMELYFIVLGLWIDQQSASPLRVRYD